MEKDTEKKLRTFQKALEEQNNLLQSILDHAPLGIWVVDQSQNPIIVNKYFQDHTGFGTDHVSMTEEELENCKLTDLTTLSKDSPQLFEEVVTYKDGRKHVLQTMKTKIYNKDGSLYGILGLGLDITDRKEMEEALKNSETYNRSIIEVIPDILIMVNRQGEYLDVITSEDDKLFLPKEQLIHKKAADFLPEEVGSRLLQAIDRSFKEDRTQLVEYELTVPAGKRWFEARIIPSDEQAALMLIRDITDRKTAELELRESRRQYQELVNKLNEGITICDADENIIFANPAATEIFGVAPGKLEGQNIREFTTRDNFQKVLAQTNRRKQGELSVYELEIIQPDGSKRLIENSASPRWENGAYIGSFSVLRDITEQKEAEEKIRYLSFHDNLTGLYNRNFFDEEMKRLDTERQLPLSIIMVDLNGLKLVNDTYGHDVGDEMLKCAAKVLKASCRSEDILARWGGDEFAIILPQTGDNELQKICQRIIDNCREAYVEDIAISIAVGSGIKRHKDTDILDVLKEAEDNMYKKKLSESKSVRSAVLNTLLKTLQAKSYETEEHALRMLNIAWKIGERIGLPDSELNRLSLLITLHDIGKINIPEETLIKETALDAEEWVTMKKHPEVGYRIARSTEEFAHVAEDILSHHERWDGTGYPRGLEGDKIPLLARIAAIADAYDVMLNGRPYKGALTLEQVIDEFKACAGTQFDPNLVEVFLNILESEG